MTLSELVTHLRTTIDFDNPTSKKCVLLYAYNGTGKTRLSVAFKDAGKTNNTVDAEGEDDADVQGDTLYFNAFTEDLFSWNNDLENDTERRLLLNTQSRFFDGLRELEMDNRIRPLLQRYADFDFTINYDGGFVNFYRDIRVEESTERVEFIKVSRGEENIFIWCFFLAVAQLAIDAEPNTETETPIPYSWVRYLYVDDPISSLDDNNAIAVASHLAQMLKRPGNRLKTVISSHHSLFFNVMCNELGNAKKYFLSKNTADESYTIQDTTDTPFFHHVSLIKDLYQAANGADGKLYTYHFNILRGILEKTASFHGFSNFSACIKQAADDPEGTVHARIINILSHGNYSLFEPREMLPENKGYFRQILFDFMTNYRFNPALFPEVTPTTAEPIA
ncbi:AAA family ATPase [Hymenobacter swuensis]|uniref:Anticodon nuclease n=1 Tax=Hymenobacter swuensis DY53 TaxID=1227739 RepID=W8EZD4_9BACT|nr:AAA family ATPase [Hymenobacter swuensis]AHJ98444.1 anticodon nuclease [Hymenobacter swuensis DY53]